MQTHFTITQNIEGKYIYELNETKMEQEMEMNGYIIFLTTFNNLNTEDIILLYKRRDTIEKSFDNLKNELDFKRLHTHGNDTTEGKIFIGFLALVLHSRILKKTKLNKKLQRITQKKIINELTKIKKVTMFDGKMYLSTLSKLQKEILSIFGILMSKFTNLSSSMLSKITNK
jgi:transposase